MPRSRAAGFPIRKSTDQRALAPPRGLSQRATSFIASRRQGIHQMPLTLRLILAIPESDIRSRKPEARTDVPASNLGLRHPSSGTRKTLSSPSLHNLRLPNPAPPLPHDGE